MKALTTLLLLIVVAAHAQQPTQPAPGTPAAPAPEALSFSGKPLQAKIADPKSLAKCDSLIAAIRSRAEITEEDYIAIGRAYVSVNQFRKAVDAYSQGLSKYPNSYKLLRHRGHRYINLRQLDRAIADLNRAEKLIRPVGEVYEFDAAGKQGATYQHQIWYHIGLYHFLKKDYSASAEAFEKSRGTSHAGGDNAGASDWLYNAYMRAGKADKAKAVLKPFTLTFDIENKDYPYYRRLLLFNGQIKPEELVDMNKPIDQMTLLEMTKLYGLANWYRYKGDAATAQQLYKKILESKEWAGFAYASAELDVQP